MASKSVNTASNHDDLKPNLPLADKAPVAPFAEMRADVKDLLKTPQAGGDVGIKENGLISISGYVYDGYTIHYYDPETRTVTIGSGRNKRDAAIHFEVAIDDLAAAMKAQRERTLPPLKEWEPVLAMSSNGKLREGWSYRRHPSDPNAVALVGTKNGVPAYVTYDNESLLRQELAMVQAVAEYTKRDFEMFSPASGKAEGGWRVTHIVHPETNKLRVFNERTGQEKFFDSVDHFLIEANMAKRAASRDEKKLEAEKRQRIEARTPKHFAYTAAVGTNMNAHVRVKEDKYQGRTRISSTSGNIDGQVYMPEGFEHKMEAIVIDTAKDPVLKAYIDEMIDYLQSKFWGTDTPSPEKVLGMVSKKIQSDFPYSYRMLDKSYARQKYPPGEKRTLGVFMKKGKESDMVCRHMGLLAEVIIEKIKAHPYFHYLLPDDLRSNFMGDQSETENDRNGHAYVIAAAPSPQEMKYYYLDPANGEKAMGEIGVDLENQSMSEHEARYLFSLLRTVFNNPDPVHTPFLIKAFSTESANPALKKIARSALQATRDPDARAAVRAFRKQLGLSEHI